MAAAGKPSGPTDRSDKFISKHAHVDTIGKNKVVIGHGSVVHPQAVLKPTNGPILVGEYCIIDEGCVIENLCAGEQDMRKIFELFPGGVAKTFGSGFGYNPAVSAQGASSSSPNEANAAPTSPTSPTSGIPPTTMCIGNNNYFGARVKINAAAIGDGNIFEPMSSVGIMSVVQDGCHLRAATRVTHDAYLPSFTVVEGGNSQWYTNPAVSESWAPEKDMLMRDPGANSGGNGVDSDEEGGNGAAGKKSTSVGGLNFTLEELQAQYLKDVAERAQAKSRYLRKVLKD